jgi:hypothetical protein
MEEVPHLLHADRAIFVSVHRFEDAFVGCLKLLQGDSSVTVAIHQRKNDAHGERPHHTSLPHEVPHRALSRHIVPAHTLPQAMPHHPMATGTGFALIRGALLRLLQLLHVGGVRIILSPGDYSATGQNGYGGRDQEKMLSHVCLLGGYRIYR